jgi:ATP-dependent Clp protease ATP-binding subunit ClpA
VFERFSDSARKVVVDAQQEARDFGHPRIGTEHLLIALVRATDYDPVLRAVWNRHAVEPADVRALLEARFGRGTVPTEGQIPITPGAKQTLERGLRACLRLGHRTIVPAHLLLGLLDTKEDTTVSLVTELVDPAELRASTEAELAGHAPQTGLPPPPLSPDAAATVKQPEGLILLLRHVTGELIETEGRASPEQIRDLHTRLAETYRQWLEDTGRETRS